ncbi:MAG: hypothetical protein ABTD50_22515 [Polyangiaceae bacterium]|jgi:hypothetical protein
MPFHLPPDLERRVAALAAQTHREPEAVLAELVGAALDEDGEVLASADARARPAGRKSLARLFAESPLKGLDLKFERDPDAGRPIKL